MLSNLLQWQKKFFISNNWTNDLVREDIVATPSPGKNQEVNHTRTSAT